MYAIKAWKKIEKRLKIIMIILKFDVLLLGDVFNVFRRWVSKRSSKVNDK